MIYFLLVVSAWGTLFLPMPRWLSLIASLAFLSIGTILLLFGMAGSYWDSNMSPNSPSQATSTLVTGVLLLLSRAVLLVKVLLMASVSPPSE
jgi:hypothetical protein